MKNNLEKRILPNILVIYGVLMSFRLLEYLVIRTDESFWSEAFLHKVVGVLILGFLLKKINWNWQKIGFEFSQVISNTILGLILGTFVYSIAYGAEYYLLISQGKEPILEWYATAYSMIGKSIKQIAPLFVVLCIGMNMVNVVMEEGIFRGLFQKLGELKYSSFWRANLLSATLFGLWHFVMAWRGYLDGNLELFQAIIIGGIAIGSSFLMGIKWGMLTKITGSLWAGMAEHFVNNTVINLLHMETSSGSDELLMLRISIAQTLSFMIILGFYIRNTRKV